MHIPRALATTAATLSSGVLIPLYIDPIGGPDCSGWGPLLNSIAAHPSVPVWAVINPASGPGAHGSQAPVEYQQCIPVLRAAAPSVVVLGYVATWEGEASAQSGVNADVSGQSGDLATYRGFAELARPLFGDGDGFIALNPGTAPSDDGYYSIADILLTAENFFSDFSVSDISLASSTPVSKQAVVLTDGPSTPPTSLISRLITTDHLKAFYVTTDSQAGGANPYDDLPTDLETYIAAIEAAQG
ncbi:hypothetical protein ONZ51_g11051 [Trametes cubensis]|uniref:Spherulation-specific family 4 n=1 Tax=Trametes cubensis TaxID=1111947 RepID=A0AAD7TIW4_9APHY|nr:hypothetical protein ONZ51_g11051 [Trametes cubensis]